MAKRLEFKLEAPSLRSTSTCRKTPRSWSWRSVGGRLFGFFFLFIGDGDALTGISAFIDERCVVELIVRFITGDFFCFHSRNLSIIRSFMKEFQWGFDVPIRRDVI